MHIYSMRRAFTLLRGAWTAPRRASSSGGAPFVLLETPAVSSRKDRVKKHGLVGLDQPAQHGELALSADLQRDGVHERVFLLPSR